jgi:hypothetical protein
MNFLGYLPVNTTNIYLYILYLIISIEFLADGLALLEKVLYG